MPNEVVIQVTGKDAGAKAALDQTAQQGKRAADSLANIGQVIGGEFLAGLAQNAFGKLNTFLMQSVEAAKGAAAAEAQLGATLQSTGGAAGLSADQIKSMASELQSLTNFEDDAILSSSNLLLTFTQIAGDTFPRAQKAVLDVSQAMGQDLQSATILVGKALNDPIRGVTALTRAGVQLTQAQKDQIATMVEAGDVAGAQAMILQELETQFGGSAEAAVAADGGITQMTNSIGDMQEEIGAKLLPVMVRWTEMKLQLLEAVLALPGPVQLIVAAVAALSLGVLILVPRLVAARAALISMGVAASVANRALGAVGLVVTALAAVMAGFAASNAETRDRVDEVGATLDEETGAITENTRAWVLNQLERSGAVQAAEVLGVGLQDLVDAALGEEEAVRRVQAALEEFSGTAGTTSAVIQDGNSTYELSIERLQELAGVVTAAQEAKEREREVTEGATAANLSYVESLQEVADQLRAQVDPVFAYLDAVDKQREAVDAAREAEQEYGENSREHRAALRDAARAAIDVAVAAGELAGTTDGRMTPALRRTLAAAGLTAAEIDALAGEMSGAAGDAGDLAEAIRGIPRRTDIRIHTSYTSSGSTAPGRFNVANAHGGVIGGAGMATGGVAGPGRGFPTQAGSMTWVGEQGPELVRLPLGSTVIPAGQSQAMIGGGGEPAMPVVEVHVYLDGAEVGANTIRSIRRALRRDIGFVRDVSAAIEGVAR